MTWWSDGDAVAVTGTGRVPMRSLAWCGHLPRGSSLLELSNLCFADGTHCVCILAEENNSE